MKSTFFTLALALGSLTTFATATPVNAEALLLDDKEICYSVSIDVGVPGVGAGVEVTGCGETAGEALEALMEGIDELI